MMAAGREQRLVLAAEGLSRGCRARAVPLHPQSHILLHGERRARTKPRTASQQRAAPRVQLWGQAGPTSHGRGQPQNRRAGRETQPQPPPRPHGHQLTIDRLLVHGVHEVPGVLDGVLEVPDGVGARALAPHPLLGALGLLLQLRQPALLRAARSGTKTRSGQSHGAQRAQGPAGRALAGPACFTPGDIHLSGTFLDALAI